MNLSLQHSLWPEKRGGENNKQPAMAAMSSFPQSKYILAYKFRSNEKKAIFIINNTIRRPDFLIRNLVKRLGYCMWMVTLRSISMHPHNIAYQHSFPFCFCFSLLAAATYLWYKFCGIYFIFFRFHPLKLLGFWASAIWQPVPHSNFSYFIFYLV